VTVSIQRIEGVKAVNVSLNEGLARVELEPGNKVTLDQLRRLIENNGFTPRQAHVRVTGRVVSANGILHLEVTGLDVSYPLIPAPESGKTKEQLESQLNRTMLGHGVIPDPQEEKRDRVLNALNFESHEDRSSE
jgi:hypothetical protein